MQQPVRVLIVDDLARARQSLKALLSTWPETAEIWQAGSGQEALQWVAELQPDVVLMDARMPEMDGLEATRLIKANWPGVKVIVLSMYADYEDKALAAGADAFIAKGEPPAALLEVLTALVAKG